MAGVSPEELNASNSSLIREALQAKPDTPSCEATYVPDEHYKVTYTSDEKHYANGSAAPQLRWLQWLEDLLQWQTF